MNMNPTLREVAHILSVMNLEATVTLKVFNSYQLEQAIQDGSVKSD